MIVDGVIAVEAREFAGLREHITEQGGSVSETAEGSLIISLNGDTLVIVNETALRLVPRALEIETQNPGTGIAYINLSLRSDAARRGLRHLLDARLHGRTARRQLEALRAMEQDANRNNRSINDALEEIGYARLVEQTGTAFDEPDQARAERITRANTHLDAMRAQSRFLESLEAAGIDVATALTALRARIATVSATRAELVLNQQEVVGLADTFTYEPGLDAVALLAERYGADAVAPPDSNGVIVVTTSDGPLTLLPSSEGASASTFYQSLLERPGVRQLVEGVLPVEPRQLRGVQALLTGQSGTWNDLGNGIGIAQARNGDTAIVVSEGGLRLAEFAIAAERVRPGAGLEVIRAHLSSDFARRGLRERWDDTWATESDLRKLEHLRDLESSGRGLNVVLTEIGRPLLIAEARAEFVQYLRDTGFFDDPWVRDMIDTGNAGEIRGQLGEKMAEMELSQDLSQLAAQTGRSYRLLSGVRVVRQLPFASKAEWISANEPNRSDFADEASYQDELRHFQDVANSIHELPSEGTVWQEVREIDHIAVDSTDPDAQSVMRIVEVKAGSTERASAQVAAKSAAVCQVLETGQVTDAAGHTSTGRIYLFENHTLGTDITPQLRMSAGEIETEVRTPRSSRTPLGRGDLQSLAQEIVDHPERFGVP